MADKKVISLEQLQMLAQRIKSENDKLNELISAIEIPTDVSDLTNDLQFQTKSDVSSAIAEAVAGVSTLSIKIVDSVESIKPEEPGADKFIYLVKKESEGDKDVYDEYMVVSQQVEKVGSTDVDLSDYVKKNGTDRLMTVAEGEKLAGIKDGANKVEKGTGNGQIKIDGEDTTIYTLPETVLQETDIADDGSVTSMLDEVFGGA